MNLPKYIKEYMKYKNFNLPPRKKPIKAPIAYFSDNKVPFSGVWLMQVLEKKGMFNSQIEKDGFQASGWGGGSSGLSEDELRDLNKIFQFKSMGFYEYERGNLGESYRFLKKHSFELASVSVPVFGKVFYVICLSYHQPYIKKAIETLVANNQFPIRISKQDIYLYKVVQGEDKNFVGAWNLDSHYVIFSNRNRFVKFKKLLGLK